MSEQVWVDDDLVTVDALPSGAWARLVDDHPPRDTDSDPWNEATFPAALIAASITEIRVPAADHATTGRWSEISAFTAASPCPVEVAVRLWDDGPVDAAEELLSTCLRLSGPRPLDWARRRLDRDPRLALEVAYCADHGLDPDVFAAWSQRSRDLVLAHFVAHRDRCPGCGVAWSAMHDLDGADILQRECLWCDQRAQAEAAVPDEARHRVHTMVVPPSRDGDGDG